MNETLLRPKKRLGQHFLTDKNILGKILAVAVLEKDDEVLEIGPGQGALTQALLAAGARVIAIEADGPLCSYLQEKFAADVQSGQLSIIHSDALQLSFKELTFASGGKLKVVANLPYNISGPVVAKFIEQRSVFSRMTLMFQKEVALRLSASSGTKDYGALSVLAQTYMDIRLEFDVEPESFFPPPKVMSSVVSMVVRDAPAVPVPDEAIYARVVKAGFAHRRKTLLNSLRDALGLKKESALELLTGVGIAPQRRGETLGLEEFSVLAAAFKPQKQGAPEIP
ncbi:MAG: ribosomal RNA small subunit methyltransferase A [Deltaproteobacteria bacterium]|nr:ribosomal RNA small subunit methyltransferase A [Deltaproteobacteria bacterium]